jgi:hypothetical protein
MRLLVPYSALLLIGCSSTHTSEKDDLIGRIERIVQLPPGAEKLESYARYYALKDQRVVGTYITLVDPKSPYYDLPIGQHRWLDDSRNLPAISDGGCSVVEVIYNPASKKVEETICNGEA